jgi:CSLREA domain-containing protein
MLLAAVFAACGEDDSPTAPGPLTDVIGTPAGQLVVNSIADPGDGKCDAAQCTLREAIRSAGSTSITFAAGLTGPIVLARPAAGGGTLAIAKSLSITGPATGIEIRRRSEDPDFRIMRVAPGAVVALRNLTISGGKTSAPGAGIINRGTLSLAYCTVSDNAGSGIDNHGPLTLDHTTVRSNSTGVVNHEDVTATFIRSTVTGNLGSGIASSWGTIALRFTSVTGNAGAGVAQTRGTSTFDHVRIIGNTGGGFSVWHGVVDITHSTIMNNSSIEGGGIRSGGSRVTISNSAIVGNVATDAGGGIRTYAHTRVSASLSLINSTVSGNSAYSGGGISNSSGAESDGSIDLINSTVAYNTATYAAGGIGAGGGDNGYAFLSNTIVAKNTAPRDPDISTYGYISASYTLVGDGTGSDLTNIDGNLIGNVSPYTSAIDPLLGALAQNGGATRTHALEAGSPAIDAAAPDGCPAVDQRDVARPQGPRCDMGSFEREVPTGP